MEVLLHALDEVGVELGGGSVQGFALGSGVGADQLDYFGLLVCGVQARDLRGVQEVVQVLNEAFVLNLGVGEEEDSGLALAARGPQQLLDVVVPLDLAVGFGDFYLDHGLVRKRGGQPGERLTAGAPHAHQQGVSSRLL